MKVAFEIICIFSLLAFFSLPSYAEESLVSSDFFLFSAENLKARPLIVTTRKIPKNFTSMPLFKVGLDKNGSFRKEIKEDAPSDIKTEASTPFLDKETPSKK